MYPQADDKYVSCLASWVNLYIGHKYDATVLISSIKDNQVGQRLSCCVMMYVLHLVHVVMLVVD